MRIVSKKEVAEAVNFLILEPKKYGRLMLEITRMIERFHDHPTGFRGNLAKLNALVDVGVHDRAAFDKLVKLIEDQRKLIPEHKRADYQRDVMRDRRARMAKALELHELRHSPMSGAERKTQEKMITERWRAARDAWIQERASLPLRTPGAWAERNDLANVFWNGVDAQLDANLEIERKRKRRA